MLKRHHPILKPVFIVGCMRSGTTLLASLLHTHPNIVYCPFELRSIWSSVGKVPMASPKTGDQTCPELGRSDVRLDIKKNLTNAFLKEFWKNNTRKRADSLFLNKNPHLCNKLPFVDELFPEARFIWIYRHMPSVVASLRKLFNFKTIHYWPKKSKSDSIRCWDCFHGKIPANIDQSRCFPGGDLTFLAEYWYETNKAVSSFIQTISNNRILIVQEEELVTNPENVLRMCMAFLDIPIIIPKGIRGKLHPERNTMWKHHFSKEDLEDLLRFVEDLGGNLNNIFPGKNLMGLYQQEIKECL